MFRPTSGLSDTPVDIAIVGGGIHGLFGALEGARRGWSVVLLERDDFGSGLSANHQRTVHGGLRALQSGRLARTRQQISERRAWAIMAPHLLRPLPFLFPTYPDVMRSRLAIGAAFRLYDWLGRGRNEGVTPRLHLPASRVESAATTISRFPGLGGERVTGGAIWYDYQVRHPDRLNWLVALAAQRAGAQLVNHAEVTGLEAQGGGSTRLRIRDAMTGDEAGVTARRVMLCAGGSVSGLHARLGLSTPVPLLRACSLLVDRPALDIALAARGPSGRVLTATPWSGRWLVGTFQPDTPTNAAADARPSRAEVDAMVDETNRTFPPLELRRRDVLLVHSGLTPATVRRGRAELLPDSDVVVHTSDSAPVCSVIGVKFTTARLTALQALSRLGLPSPGAGADPVPLPYGTSDGASDALRTSCLAAKVEIDEPTAARLVDWYGTEAADVLAFSAAAGLSGNLAPGCPWLEGELVYAVDRSQAMTLADVVLRRTGLGTAGHPGRAVLDRAAAVVGSRLGWSEQTRTDQVLAVEARYEPGLAPVGPSSPSSTTTEP